MRHLKKYKTFNEGFSEEYYNEEDANYVIELFQEIVDEYNLQKLLYDGPDSTHQWPTEPGIYYWFETRTEESRFNFNICFEIIESQYEYVPFSDIPSERINLDNKNLKLWKTLDKIFKNDMVELGKRIQAMDPNHNIFYIGHYNLKEYQSILNKEEKLGLYELKAKYENIIMKTDEILKEIRK